jgi:imidazolonepropionase
MKPSGNSASVSGASQKTADIIISPIGEIATPAHTDMPARGPQLGNVLRIKGGAIAISGDEILWFGAAHEVKSSVAVRSDTQFIDAANCLVTPGLVDAHTHLVFAGDRANEFVQRCQGKSYAEIAAAGGGIVGSVKATKSASLEDLVRDGHIRLKNMLMSGTTTCEIKTGYGLDLESELKMLKAILSLAESQPIEIVPTFMAAHAIPPGKDGDSYVNVIIEEMLPAVAKIQKAARKNGSQTPSIYMDVFCDQGYFSVEQSKRLLEAGLKFGLIPKIHSDEFVNLGATKMAVQLGAATADHLLKVSPAEIELLAKSNTVAVLLPGTSFFLNLPEHAPARALIEAGAAVCVASDFNPGSCHISSLPFIMGLSSLHLGMSANEVLTAVTVNAAHAVGLGRKIGQIREGYQADITIYDVSDLEQIAYNIGAYMVRSVLKKGRIVFCDKNKASALTI